MDTRSHQWREPPSHVALREDEVHIWRAPLELNTGRVARLRSSLSDDERARADRFYFEKDRLQFTVAHGILRDIIGRYCGVDPAELRFSTGPHGKPAMEQATAGERIRGTNRSDRVHGTPGRDRVRKPPATDRMHGMPEGKQAHGIPPGSRVEFNMSHSRWMALYAVALQRAVGVDIEYIREDLECERIAERFFHENETAHLRRLPERERRDVFFQLWTLKEAYIKGRGKGLSIPTRSFAVRLIDDVRAVIGHGGMDEVNGATPAGSAVIGHHEISTVRSSSWSLFALDPAPGYAGAVAVKGDAPRLVLWEW